MSEEIKEILDRLNKIFPYASVPKELAYMTTNITPQECKVLLDYITNLQQENKQLKEELDYIKPRYDIAMDLVDKGVENSYKMVKDYKFRCEKAIEYIEKKFPTDFCEMEYEGALELLEILGDKE